LSAPEHETPEPGRVYLVGAGPGDPGLLTARAKELIARADTILYDRLIPERALDGAGPEAELLFVGKQGGGGFVPQERTQALMIERAREGRMVVRLKGGDPFVFGRGGEEALALREAGIEFGVVPGVTAGVAAAAYAGIPVTHRGLSTAVALITGHTRADTPRGGGAGGEPAGGASEPASGDEPGGEPELGGGEPELGGGEPELDWRALAAFPGTLVFYMGVRALPRISSSLIEAGRAASEPAAVIEAGTLPRQRTVRGTLSTIAHDTARARVEAPAITVVGAVAALADELDWLVPRPLAGRTVAVTRARPRASYLARRLEELGASVVQAPTIRTRATPNPTPIDPSPYDLVCLTSPVAVEHLFERLHDAAHPPGDARALAGALIAAIGPATVEALERHGITADLVPERAVAESLVETLAGVRVRRALVPRAREARDVLPDALRARGAEVDVVALYETAAEPLSVRELERARQADYITFTSSSTVRFFLQAAAAAEGDGEAGGDGEGERDGAGSPPPGDTPLASRPAGGAGALSEGTRIVSIGPATSAALREHGFEPHVEAARHDVEGLVEALLTDAIARRV
jgi:uroporphyrinogen III methyltransferase / synthase